MTESLTDANGQAENHWMGDLIFEEFLSRVGSLVVINLPHRADRRAEFGAQLSRVGLSFDHPMVRIFRAFRPDDAAGFPTIGTRGCFLSHLGVLRDAAASGAKAVLICEDDLDFTADILRRLPGISAALDAVQWDILYGGYSTPPKGKDVASGLVAANAADGILGAHFYALKGSVIPDLIAYLEAILQRPPGHPDGGPMHFDGALSWFRAANPQYVTVAVVPEIGTQRPSRTDIHTLRWFDRWPGVRDVVEKLRRLRAGRTRP